MPQTKLPAIADLLGQAVKSAQFCVNGCLDEIDPELQVKGIGKLQLPLSPDQQAALTKRCKTAPYGKGTRTLVNRNVRNTLELDPARFELGEAWQTALKELLPKIAAGLGLEDQTLEAQLYKLLVYEAGGFFLPHRDSEKCDDMVASLVVVLPSPFGGGELIVRHGEASRRPALEQAASGRSSCYAAFFADCEHEVRPVRSGLRICLTYNLVLRRGAGRRSRPRPSNVEDVMAEHLRKWCAAKPAEPLVLALSHQYTERSLSMRLLKGGDRELASLIAAAAKQADCCIYLAHVTRHLLQDASDGSYDYGRRDRWGWGRSVGTDIDKLEIGETIEDELSASKCVDTQGRKQPWGELPLNVDNIVSLEPIDQWAPDEEDYEGYTGNAGNTLDRWYHRAALLVWHRDDHYEVIADGGVDGCITILEKKLEKLPALAEKSEAKFEAEHADCLRLARAIVSHWPTRRLRLQSETQALNRFPSMLLQLYDRETIARFLDVIAEKDAVLSPAKLIVDASREFGWDAFAPQLRRLLAFEDSRRNPDMAPRDANWLAAYCTAAAADPDGRATAAELCNLAIERFCLQANKPYNTWEGRGDPAEKRETVEGLFKAFCAFGDENLQRRVVASLLQSQKRFTPDDCQVPCLESLLPWARRQFDAIPAALQQWLDALTRQLEEATRSEPQPPTDWARPAEVDERSQYGKWLNAFLADPARETDAIAAAESQRQGLISLINEYRCDVTHRLVKQGRPYTLKLTKTNASFDRTLKRYQDDLKLLSKLNSLKSSMSPP